YEMGADKIKENMKMLKINNPDYAQRQRESALRWHKLHKNDPDYKEKSRLFSERQRREKGYQLKAHTKAKALSLTGYCYFCKSISNLVRHHTDYSKPLEVIILCKSCH